MEIEVEENLLANTTNSGAISETRAILSAGLIIDRTKAIADLKAHLSKSIDAIKNKFDRGELSGLQTAGAICTAHDEVLQGIFAYATHDAETSQPQDETIAICAVGGYGRGEMAPFSDLDLLFLTSQNTPSERCNEIAELVLYLLWDMGLKVGHAVRAPEQCITLARQDETVLTALLDIRFLGGEEPVMDHLKALVRKERSRAKKKAYVAAKLANRDTRHQREGNSRYVIEPNIKEGKGGLRDLHELYWIARFVHGGRAGGSKNEPDQPYGVEAYLRLGLLDEAAALRFKTAAEFLWKTRIHLHFLSGRAREVLSFDTQDALAKQMGYVQDVPEERVEAFMRDYFMTTREVGALTRIACAKLEEINGLLLPQGLDRFLPTSRRGLKQPGFVLDRGRLDFSNTKVLQKNPFLILELFLVAGVRNLDIHPDAFATLSQNLNLIDDTFRGARQAAEIFEKILLDTQAPGAVLRTMNEASVLGTYLPEFGDIVGRTQFNMHHAYTVDDHTLSLISFLHDIESGRFEKEHPLTTSFTKSWSNRLRRMVYFACLFHDVGKGKGDQCIEGARLAILACRRLGLPDGEVETVAWLVRNHLEMSETAQRRDTTDPDTIENFATIVGSVSRLQMLTALTVVDMRAVGPGIWNDWRGELIRSLYRGTQQVLMGESETPEPAPLQGLLSQLPPEEAAASKAIFEAMPVDYWQNFSEDKQKLHAEFFREAGNASCLVKAHLHRANDITELWVLTRDRPKLFADLAGAIASKGASIVGAQLNTGEKRSESDATLVFNVFYLQNTEGLAFGRKNPSRLRNIEKAAALAAEHGMENVVLPPRLPSKRAAAIPIAARVVINPTSETTAIIEIEGRDRIGLLHELGVALVTHNISMRSAHIEVAGPKAIDVFYVDFPENIDIMSCGLDQTLLAVMNKKEDVVA